MFVGFIKRKRRKNGGKNRVIVCFVVILNYRVGGLEIKLIKVFLERERWIIFLNIIEYYLEDFVCVCFVVFECGSY